AVDAHVDQHLWQHLIGPTGLLKDKTRILVTHGIHHLEHVDQIVVLKDGSINEVGDYQHLMDSHGAFYQLIKDFSATHKRKNNKHTSSSTRQHLRDLLHGKKDTTKDGIERVASSVSNIDMDNSLSDSEGDSSERNTIVEEAAIKKTDDATVNKDDSGELIEDEKMEEGKVGWQIVLSYARAASYRNALLCIVLFALAQACHIGTNFWLRYWISDSEARERDGQEPRPASHYLIGYAWLVVLYMCLDVVVHYTAQVICGIRASRIIYDQLLTRVLRLPMSFFDVTPMGRILNRFSSDISAIDSQLPWEWKDLFKFASIIVGTLFVIAYSTPIFLFAIPPLVLVYYWIQDYFIKSSSSLKRLYSVSKSPLYQHFSETLTGVSTIRVTKGLREQFVHENDERVDMIVNRFTVYNYDSQWLTIRLESLGAIIIFIASTLAVFYAGDLDPSLVGLALSYALNIMVSINCLVITASEVQNVLVSVERMEEYSQKPTEAPIETGVRLPENWPSEGRVVFKNYSTRYREGLDLVIKN
ncbi:Canalicular multispecific organic anion transporter 1, partial [Dissophora globulifera]